MFGTRLPPTCLGSKLRIRGTIEASPKWSHLILVKATTKLAVIKHSLLNVALKMTLFSCFHKDINLESDFTGDSLEQKTCFGIL